MKLGYISFRLVRVSLWLMCIIIFLDLFKDFSYCSQFCCIVLPLSHILIYHTQNTNFTKNSTTFLAIKREIMMKVMKAFFSEMTKFFNLTEFS